MDGTVGAGHVPGLPRRLGPVSSFPATLHGRRGSRATGTPPASGAPIRDRMPTHVRKPHRQDDDEAPGRGTPERPPERLRFYRQQPLRHPLISGAHRRDLAPDRQSPLPAWTLTAGPMGLPDHSSQLHAGRLPRLSLMWLTFFHSTTISVPPLSDVPRNNRCGFKGAPVWLSKTERGLQTGTLLVPTPNQGGTAWSPMY